MHHTCICGYSQLHTAVYLTRVKPCLGWCGRRSQLGGQLLEFKKGKDRNGKTGLNPWKDVRRSEIASQLGIFIRLSKEGRLTFEKLNFCNIMDLQLKLSISKATSTTVQDVHPDIARRMIRKSPGKLRAYIPMQLSYSSSLFKDLSCL